MPKALPSCLAAGVLAASLAGCGTPDDRYKSENGLDFGTPPPLTLDISSQPAPAAPAAAISLPERAEAAYITALAAKIKDPAAFQAAVAKPLTTGGGGSSRTSLTRILLITVSQQGYYPADRLVFMRVRITPNPTQHFAFAGLTAAATAWATQSIDSLDISNDVKFQPEFDATLGGSLVGSLKNPVSVDHSTDVKATTVEPYEKLTANIDSNGALVLTGTGARGIDLTGTSMVKLDLVPTPGYDPNVKKYIDADNYTVLSGATWLPSSKAKITLSPLSALGPVAYTVDAHLDYVVRHVVNGQGLKTYREDDDVVAYVPGHKDFLNIPLAQPTDTGLSTWVIIDERCDPLKIATPLGFRQPVFTSYDGAAQFAAWLNLTAPQSIGGWKLIVQPTDNSSITLPITKTLGLHAITAQTPFGAADLTAGDCSPD